MPLLLLLLLFQLLLLLGVVRAAPSMASAQSLLFTEEVLSVASSRSNASALDASVLQQIRARALQQEQPDAMYVLAMLQLYGHGVARDVAAAVKLLRRLAHRTDGHREAALALGLLHGSGEGVAQSDRQSAAWLTASANRGHDDAKWMLAVLYNEGRGVETADPRRALALLQDAAGHGNPRALFHLGVMHEYGRGGAERNASLAADLYESASDQHVPEAMYYLALQLAAGRGRRKDTARARQLLVRAASAPHAFAPAMYQLGELHASVPPLDYSVALYWFTQAAAQRDGHEQDHHGSRVARQRVQELSRVLAQAEAYVREQEQALGLAAPLRVHVALPHGQ